MLPLHKEAKARPRGEAPNAGLLFEKYSDVWQFGFSGVYASADQPNELKSKFYRDSADSVNDYSAGLARDYVDRRHQLLFALKGRAISAATEWRMVSGLGSAHPLEAGFIWHRTLGVPYLPGSSIKGMMRAWLTHWIGDERKATELFGDSEGTGVGRLVVFDAIPVGRSRLEVDIMNPHYGSYYADATRKTPPADYSSPVPVSFLAVAPGQRFEFALAPANRRCTLENLAEGMRSLQEALSTIGCGGKTAVGYGVFGKFQDATDSVFKAIAAAKAKASDEAEARLKAEAREAKLTQLSWAEKLIYDLETMIEDGLDVKQIKDASIQKVHPKLSEAEGADKLAIAEGLMRVWKHTGDWSGKLSDKQATKVLEIKKLLGEV